MTASTENIKKWIEQSDIDYYTHFIKAWIPFNAWYVSSYKNLDGDRAIINEIKKNPSGLIRKAINYYLDSAGQDGEDFRSYLAALHHSLTQADLDGSDCKISFLYIVREKNTETTINETNNNILYHVNREDSDKLGEIKKILIAVKRKDNSNLFVYEHHKYDFSHLQSFSTKSYSYDSLSGNQKEKTRLLFERMNPIIQTSAIETHLEESPQNYYKCDTCNFKRDNSDTNSRSHIVAKALIEILYQLRNILFHGELTPTEATKPVYKNAYFLLKMLLDKIK